MIHHRMKQFREYNGLEKWMIAELLDISADEYELLENGKNEPTIDLIQDLARCYKVTVDEFYGYTPRVTLHSNDDKFDDLDDGVPSSLLKMSDLSWEESQIILYYRKYGSDDEVIKSILEKNFPQNDNK